MKYMIHACNSRMWYVDDYLVPSLLKQVIAKDDIYVYQDKDCEGNLKSYIKSCHLAYEMWGETNVWHMQDDVIVSAKFKERTEELEENPLRVISAFTCKYDDGRGPGEAECKNHIWYSFPCTRINSRLSKEFASWCDTYLWRDNQFGFWTRYKKGDDYIFRVFMESYHPKEHVLNLIPNLVDHIDFLLGGTVVNPQRQMQGADVRSMYWDENDLVCELGDRIRKERIDK